MTIIRTHKTYLPSFGVGDDQSSMGIWTVLCVGGSGKDCAAYQGIVPDVSMRADKEEQEEVLKNKIRSGGNKLSREKAEKLFGKSIFSDDADLQYRR